MAHGAQATGHWLEEARHWVRVVREAAGSGCHVHPAFQSRAARLGQTIEPIWAAAGSGARLRGGGRRCPLPGQVPLHAELWNRVSSGLLYERRPQAPSAFARKASPSWRLKAGESTESRAPFSPFRISFLTFSN